MCLVLILRIFFSPTIPSQIYCILPNWDFVTTVIREIFFYGAMVRTVTVTVRSRSSFTGPFHVVHIAMLACVPIMVAAYREREWLCYIRDYTFTKLPVINHTHISREHFGVPRDTVSRIFPSWSDWTGDRDFGSMSDFGSVSHVFRASYIYLLWWEYILYDVYRT